MDVLERRIAQLEANMRQMQQELAELRQERRRANHPADSLTETEAPHTAAPPYGEIPQGYAAHEQQGMQRQPYPQQQQPTPEYLQQQGIPGYPPAASQVPSYPGQAPYGYQQAQGTGPAQGNGQPHYDPGFNPYAYQQQHAGAAPREPKPPKDWEHLIARVWLPRVFIVVLLLGVLWGFTAAVSAGYLTEPIRCLLGVVVAAVMYWLGERQIRSQREALGQVLLGGAVGVLILSVFAAHELYDLIPSGLAFVLYILSIALGVFTALRRRSQTLIIIATVAGYLIPFLVHSAHPNAWVFTGYEAVFSLAMIAVALKFDFRAAYFVAVGVLHLLLLIGYAAGDFSESRHIFIAAVFIQHAVLLGYAFVGPKQRKLDQTLSLFLGYGIMVLWIYALYPFTEDSIHWRPLMLFVWALVYTLAAWGKHLQAQRAPVFAAIATTAWFLWMLDILNHSYSPAAAVVIGTAGILLGFKLKSYMQQITATVIFLYGLSGTIFMVIHEIVSAQSLSWIVLLISIAVLAYSLRHMSERLFYDRLPDVLMWVDALLAIIFITQITNVFTADLTYDFRHLILSAVWALYAIAVIICGVLLQKQMVRIAGIGLLFLTLVKVIIVDLPGVSVAIRAILFIGLGALGMVVSRLLYKRKNIPPSAPASDDTPIEP
ncbi:DUF2339 domain-containing protein [Paenibacillus sp. KQZ6P-2]|uniref:DUF2339 domain-containing protein n=1 Tax=Paenibacillus mangrovi TaxID=2931978 RepID=A0A9X1WUM7_9BACL|nr:DUF2339 domain-containing protein [Paenibacillus mangrovi]MCJ8014000.1 DUF2339 domain-containing protein [Paenibacillus mangrovi]